MRLEGVIEVHSSIRKNRDVLDKEGILGQGFECLDAQHAVAHRLDVVDDVFGKGLVWVKNDKLVIDDPT